MRYLLLGAAFCGLVANRGWTQAMTATNHPLSVEETLGAVFLGEPAFNVYRLANKEAKPTLYEWLNNRNAEECHPAILWILGFIGDETDVKRVEQVLTTRFSGELTKTEQATIQAAFGSLGIMARREVNGAAESLGDMLRPSFWGKSTFRWPAVERAGKTTHNYETVAWAFLGYALSGKPDLETRVAAILADISEPEAKKYMEHRINPLRMNDYAQSFETAQMQPIDSQVRALLPHLFNKDFENPRRAAITIRNSVSQTTGPERRTIREAGATTNVSASLKQEALSTFAEIVQDLLNDQFSALATHLADNGRPLLPKARQNESAIAEVAKKLEAMADMKTTKTLVQGVCALGLNYGEAQGELRSDGTLIVKIPCLGSQEIKNRHLPRHNETRTTDAEGRLVIYMIKQDGQWYWNPFGW